MITIRGCILLYRMEKDNEVRKKMKDSILKTEKYRYFFRLRTSDKAHPQMREIAKPILNEFRIVIPVVFCDIL